MLHRPRPAMRRSILLALALILASIVACAAAGRAAAAPLEPTLNVQQLQALLDASGTGTVSGYFLSVDKGSHIARIPMTVDAIEDNAGPDGALILFQADMTDPVMATIGNIAGGMSGSPLYVPDGGTDKLIGALSYGDIFTLAGYGMATPIEYMSAIEAKYPASVTARDAQTAVAPARTYTTTLQQPVAAGGGAVNRIVVTPSTAVAASTAHPAGTLVFAPMESAQISGLPYGSKAYQAMADALQKRGITVQRGLSASSVGSGSPFTAPLQAGSSLVSMYAIGDFFAGYIGTVTYVDGQSLMAFGHPIDWIGATSEYLCNFRVDAIWADSMEAYKVGSLGAVRGTVLQDRGSGVAARLDRTPAQVPITAHASVTTDATRTADGASYLTQFWADSGLQLGSSLAASAVSAPIYRASDAAMLPGSATTVSTVKVTDGTNHYTVRVANLWDDAADVEYEAAQDIYKIVGTLEANPNGVAPAIIESIDLQADVTSARRSATIADVTAPTGLHTGINVLHVQVYANGQSAPQTVDVPLTIPADAATSGQITVVPATYDDWSSGFSSMSRSAGRAADPRLTLAQTVDLLNATATNDAVEVQFDPSNDEDGSAVVTGTAHSGWVIAGRVTKRATTMTLMATPARVKKHGRVTLRGRIENLSTAAVVHIYRRYLGSAKSTQVGTVTAVPGGSWSFAWRSGKLSKGAVFTATWDGTNASDPTATSTTLGASASVLVPLRRH
jgi:hypothetical protein